MLNLEQYSEICKKCDKILLENSNNKARISIPWLHVLNEHPANLIQYEIIYKEDKIIYHTHFLNYLFSSIKILIKSIFKPITNQNRIRDNSVIFISHLLDPKDLNVDEDFYFGNLQNEIDKINKPNHLLLLNHTNLSSLFLNESSYKNNKTVFPEYLRFKYELKLRINLFRESIRLYFKSLSTKNDFLQKRIYKYASIQALNNGSLLSLRLYYYLFSLIKLNKINLLLTTYEGHSWERMAFAACNNKIKVKSVGYHHTIIFNRQHAIFREIKINYEPELIFTAGDYAKSYFININKNVYTLGTYKFNSLKESINKFPITNKNPTCLVLPDAIISEIIYIFRLVLNFSKDYKHINFIFRLHPAINKTDFINQYNEFAILPNNICFSNNDLNLDFEKSNWFMYRGSNSAIYALIMGLRPIYIAKENELTLDCLFNFNEWKKVVYNYEELLNVFNSDLKNIIDYNFINEMENDIKRAKSYFMPFNIKIFINNLFT